MRLNKTKIEEARAELENHSLLVTNSIQTIDDLVKFMDHHVYAVWDFMSLLKTVQHNITPSGNLWLPTTGSRSEIARMVNEIVLCEESDVHPSGGSVSHYDLYLLSMLEVGCDINPVEYFIDKVEKGNDPTTVCMSKPAAKFMKTTFDVIKQGPHCAAASFAYGRETVIPAMFTRILNQLDISGMKAPMFHYYLQRHIEVDGDEHGPMSEKLVEYFCEDNPMKIHQAEKAAIDSINARIKLFDDIELILSL